MASFVAGNSTFNANGTPLRRTALVVDSGISHQITNKRSAYADLGYEARGNGQTMPSPPLDCSIAGS